MDESGGIEALKEEIKERVARENFEVLINRLQTKCMESCKKKDFSSTDTLCIGRCVDRYIEGWNLVFQASMREK